MRLVGRAFRDRYIPVRIPVWLGGADVGEDLIGLLAVGQGRVVVGSGQRMAEGRVRVCRAEAVPGGVVDLERELGLAGCPRVPALVDQRVRQRCPGLAFEYPVVPSPAQRSGPVRVLPRLFGIAEAAARAGQADQCGRLGQLGAGPAGQIQRAPVVFFGLPAGAESQAD